MCNCIQILSVAVCPSLTLSSVIMIDACILVWFVYLRTCVGLFETVQVYLDIMINFIQLVSCSPYSCIYTCFVYSCDIVIVGVKNTVNVP